MASNSEACSVQAGPILMRGSSLNWVGVLWETGELKLKLLPTSFLVSSLDPTLESLEHLVWAFSFNDPNVLPLFEP